MGWFIVFIFISMTVTSLLLVFGLDPSLGNLKKTYKIETGISATI